MNDYPPLLKTYVFELLLWNKGMNLIGKSTEKDVWEKHIADSLELLPFLQKEDISDIIDIGSGGGLPAIPLSILLPEKCFILTEVDSKKLAFLEFIIKKLKVNAKAVDINRGFLFEKECIITSRAFSEIKNILEWSGKHTPEVKKFLLLKGREEIVLTELKNAGNPPYQIHPLNKGCIVEIILKNNLSK